MSYYTHTEKPIGQFVEKEVGNYFEYSLNDDDAEFCADFPHKIWVCDGYRYGHVKNTVVTICVDEDEYGQPVTQRWYIKKKVDYNPQ